MKQSKIIIPVIVAAVVFLAVLATGLYIRKAGQNSRPAESNEATKPEIKQPDIRPRPPYESRQSPRTVSSEQKEQLGEQIEDIKRRWASMSGEERQEFKAKMLEMFDARRREAGRRLPGQPPDEDAIFRDEIMLTKKKWEDMSEEERQEFSNKMRERANAIRQGND